MRADLQVVAELVHEGARVLDLGCGEGELLAYLKAKRQAHGIGIGWVCAHAGKAQQFFEFVGKSVKVGV